MAKATLDKNGLAKADGTLTVYGYDALTGEFTGAVQEFLAQGVGLPACSCLTAPPDAQAGTVAVYQDGSWLNVPDHRGETVYPVSGGAPVKITALGDYPADTTTLAPATAFDKWDGEKWVTDSDAQHQSRLDAAATEKAERVSEANGITQAWQTQLLLGIITDADKATLTAWMKYVQAVQATDVSGAPDISWPEKPA
ncbi:tail fiber assembly protein [Pantoea sp. B550]|uniref:tail fiber assembly protein n=1 Tax=Pantoea sp. B550 TaxID=2959338 RepID=UPI0020A05E0A|nr:tail fiber assembly protein [Pantoea sp. B550]MCP1205492.1 tail fiber assembly protein [Pantoea sp. B550]